MQVTNIHTYKKNTFLGIFTGKFAQNFWQIILQILFLWVVDLGWINSFFHFLFLSIFLLCHYYLLLLWFKKEKMRHTIIFK